MSVIAWSLVVLWILGCVSSLTLSGYLHLLLLVPLGVVVPQLVRGRKVPQL